MRVNPIIPIYKQQFNERYLRQRKKEKDKYFTIIFKGDLKENTWYELDENGNFKEVAKNE